MTMTKVISQISGSCKFLTKGGHNKLRKTITKTVLSVITLVIALLFCSKIVSANTREQGVDLSVYQGYTAVFGQKSDKFSINQIGGYYQGRFVVQPTYKSQVSSTIAQGKRAHTYIYSEFNNRAQADQMLNYYLPRVQTPKGSIVALDVESGYPTTDNIMYALNKVRKAGFTAMLYTSKSYASGRFNLQQISNSYPLWLAEYPDYQVRKQPYYAMFPSFNNVNIFQFTSTYRAGGLDGNVDLTGITKNGYNGTYKPATGGRVPTTNHPTQAVKQGQNANKTPKSAIKVGNTVKVNYSANRWSNGLGIANFVKGHSYKVIQVSGNKVLLGGIMSWINKSDVEITLTSDQTKKAEKKVVQQSSNTYYTVRSGDFASTIAQRYGITTSQLKSWNGIANINLIYPGQRLIVKKGAATTKPAQTSTGRYRIVQNGDSLSRISYLTGYSISYLQTKNHLSNPNFLRIGQRIYY